MTVSNEGIQVRRRFHPLLLSFWLVLVVFILVGSLVPVVAIPQATSFLTDKLQHFGAYFLLGLLALSATRITTHMMILFLSSFLLGVVIEFLQPLTGRYFEVNDMIANSAGMFAALLCYGLFRILRNKSVALHNK